ncbi:putative N-acetylmannosamine-6-phosphate 2-epimerase [Kaistia dalseonensis]|nr:putative N-acetylmannosamine-6-phosphate 2-epimerase [Kaistia dalseonensis]
MSIIEALKGRLVVSCQPVIGGPMDRPEIVAAYALAAEAGGASALRIQGLANLRAVRAVTKLPIIGLIKRDDPSTPIIITATIADVEGLAEAGADIIAFDATLRDRPESVATLNKTAHAAGKLSMADCASIADARAALAAGCDVIGTTLSGYTGGPVPEDPDIAFVAAAAALGAPVFAEGRYRTVSEVRAAREAGAWAVVVGSAITRPEHITGWFVDAVSLKTPAEA